MEFLILLFAFAALVWMIPIIHSGRLIRIAMIVLLIGTALGPPFFNIDGVIQFSLDRILWFGMLGLAAVHWRMGNFKLPKLTRIDWLVIALVGYVFLSSLSAGSGPYLIKAFSRWLFYFVMPAGIYFIARVADIRKIDFRWLSLTSILLSLYLAVTAIFEVKGFHAAVFPKFIVDPAASLEFLGRGRGPLLNPVANGFVMSLGVTACVFGFINSNHRMRAVYALLTLVISIGAYETLTRSVWVGIALIFAVVALCYGPRWLRIWGMAAAVMLGGAMSLGLKDQLLSIKRDKHLSAAEAAESVELRPLLAIVAWEMFKAKPIMGHGYGRYFQNNKPYCDTRSYEMPLEKVKGYIQHNVFLSILVDLGLVGFLLFMGLLGSLLLVGWHLACQYQKPEVRHVGLLVLCALGTYAVNGMFHDVTIIPMMHMFLFFAAGVGVTVMQRGFATEEAPVRSERRARVAVGAQAAV